MYKPSQFLTWSSLYKTYIYNPPACGVAYIFCQSVNLFIFHNPRDTLSTEWQVNSTFDSTSIISLLAHHWPVYKQPL